MGIHHWAVFSLTKDQWCGKWFNVITPSWCNLQNIFYAWRLIYSAIWGQFKGRASRLRKLNIHDICARTSIICWEYIPAKQYVFLPASSAISWWRHQMETFSALLTNCAGNSPVSGEFPAQRPVRRSADVFFDLRLNKRLSKQSWGWWFETLSRPLWRHCNTFFLTLLETELPTGYSQRHYWWPRTIMATLGQVRISRNRLSQGVCLFV